MKQSPLVLHSFVSLKPRYQGAQGELIDWIIHKHSEVLKHQNHPEQLRLAQILKRFAVTERQIERRFFEADREEIYQVNQHQLSGADIGERHRFFQLRALEILRDFYQYSHTPSHLIHVTCTGYVSPSAPQVYFSARQQQPEITHAYHMGCYAALPAVRMAMGQSRLTSQTVDVLHTEMCSLHLDPSNHTPEQLVVQTLFADGHIKYSLDQDAQGPAFLIHSIKERLIPNSSQDMTWVPGAHGMQMTLSKEVPVKIRDEVVIFLKELATENGLSYEELLSDSLFAIHPGGPKIIDSLQDRLHLRDEQITFSREILRARGNMSSATLPHVWQKILKSGYEGRVVSLAFGPGLTIFGSLFEARQ
jgi:predicted naringenin-chalcone synthase